MENVATSEPSAQFERAVLDAIGLAALVTDRTGTITAATPHLAHLVAAPVHTLIGRSVADLFHPDDLDRLERLLFDPGCPGAPAMYRLKNNDEAWASVEVVPVPGAAGPLVDGHVLALRASGADMLLDEPIRAIAADEPLPDVLAAIVTQLTRGSLRAPVSILWDRQDGVFASAFHANLPEALIDAVDMVLDLGTAPPVWSTAQAQPDGSPFFIAATLPHTVATAAATAGFGSGLVVPFSDDHGLPSGVFILWSETTDPTPSAATAAGIERLRWVAHIAASRDLDRTRLLHASSHDPLTGLANRSRFYAVVDRQARRGEIAILHMDIEQFSRFNDHFGASVGDEVLVEVARRLQEVVRPTDMSARIGADEFAVVLTQAPDRDAIQDVSERIREAVRLPIMTTAGSVTIKARVRESRPVANAPKLT